MSETQESLAGRTDNTLQTYCRLKRRLMAILQDLRDTRDQGQRATADDSNIPLFKGMLRNLEKEYKDFETVWTDMCNLDEEEGEQLLLTPEDRELRSRARRYFCEASASAEALISTSRVSVLGVPLSSSTRCSNSRQKTSLPSIPIPSFDGQRTQWRQFKDVFDPLVNKDPTLTDAERFYYLAGALKGPAAAIIAKLPPSAENYKTAWELLDKTYDKPRILASQYIEKILNLKALSYKPPTEILQNAIADISKAVAAFMKLDIPDRADFLLFHLTSRCLHPKTQEDFELAREDKQFPSYDDLIAFLYKQCEASEVRGVATPTSPPSVRNTSRFKKPSVYSKARPYDALGVQVKGDTNPSSNRTSHGKVIPETHEPTQKSPSHTCYLCNGNHALFTCDQFKTLSLEERHDTLKNWKGCRNCLSAGHQISSCKSRLRCRHCHSKHHTLLHREKSTLLSSGPSSSNIPPAASCNLAPLYVPSHLAATLMGTAVTNIIDVMGRPHHIRLVLDSASHVSFVTRSIAERCGFKIRPLDITIHGVTNLPLTGLIGQARCSLHPDPAGDLILETNAVVVENIMSPQPRTPLDKELYDHYLKYDLADHEFYHPGPIEFLLGCDLFGEVLTGDIVTVHPSMPRLVGTVFGHIVIGRIGDIEEVSTCANVAAKRDDNQSLNAELQLLWALDEFPSQDPGLNQDNHDMEKRFQESHQRLPSGRYVVRLPFKTTPPSFPGHQSIAFRRLQYVERKLQRDAEQRQLYQNVMMEYLQMDHMALASSTGKYCIPHHGVFKTNPPSVRVVFDASSRTQNGSLNDVLCAGPKLQNDLFTILLNFRLHQVAFTVDIVKMFRQIIVHASDRTYQHVLWRSSPAVAVQEFEMRTLPFGLSCSPYLALRVVKQLIKDEGEAFPRAAKALSEDMYIDDIVTGAQNVEDALFLQAEIIALLKRGQFPVSKWASSHQAILDAIPDDLDNKTQKSPLALDLGADTVIKILGLQWDPQRDVLGYAVDLPSLVPSKRGALSLVARLYDPLGFVSPSILLAKLIIQEAWRQELDWDTPLPSELQESWLKLIADLPTLRQLQIPRNIFHSQVISAHLLCFADASERAYCATAYLRIQTADRIISNLIFARTRIAPVKSLTVPRLELCAALLTARMVDGLFYLQDRVSIPLQRLCFSDSMIVLHWLRKPTERMPIFIGNRVSKILQLTKGTPWHHIKSGNNPSDLGTRGLLPHQLIGNALWFHGPHWLSRDPSTWPLQDDLDSNRCESFDCGHTTIAASTTIPSAPNSVMCEWMEHFSSFTKLTRSMAFILRFIHNARSSKETRNTGNLSLAEIKQGRLTCCRLVQGQSFFHGHLPQSGQVIPQNLWPMSPFLNEDRTLVVGGRLKNARLPTPHKHPILLPKKSHLTKLIIDHYHRMLLHPGPSMLIAAIRQQYWVVGLRDLARQCTRACVSCRRGSSPSVQPLMGELPQARFHAVRPFLSVGIDFGGPFMIKESLRRKSPLTKAYMALFICMSTKAVHLEVVSSLSTPSFLGCLERFAGRRGWPCEIHSDNGTNFVGAAQKLEEWHRWLMQTDTRSTLEEHANVKGFKWKFIPPHAPHFGGLWEAGVKSAKRLLRLHYADSKMTFEELATLLIRIEAILNSRPLCPLSQDPNDFEYLSPAHFLIGSSLIAAPEPCEIDPSPSLLHRWDIVRNVAQHFWGRWRKEYLSTMQIRAKWHRSSPNLHQGDLVFLKDDRVPRLHWPRGRIEAIHPGTDGVVRVVDVRTSQGIYRRPATKLIPLFPPKEEDIRRLAAPVSLLPGEHVDTS